MKSRVEIYLCMMTILVLMAGCNSEDQFARRRSPKDRAVELRQLLDLTDEQTAAIETIYVEMDKKMAGLRDESEGDRQTMRESFRSLREETDKAIEEVLFEDQREKYRAIMEERRANMRQRRRD